MRAVAVTHVSCHHTCGPPRRHGIALALSALSRGTGMCAWFTPLTTLTTMECPTCNHLNSAMAVHCTQCGTTLIHEAVGHSAAYQEGMRTLDTRMHVGLGAIAGFFLIAFLLNFVFTAHGWSDRDVWSAALVGAVGGAFLGRLLLKARLAS